MNGEPELNRRDRILGGLVGDALGVPAEFMDRASLQSDPVIDMRAFGSHRQPAGTWSDDSSLLLCTVDSLLHDKFDSQDLGQRFVRWKKRRSGRRAAAYLISARLLRKRSRKWHKEFAPNLRVVTPRTVTETAL